MKWDQIKTKWALMTRRIRADICDERHDAVQVVERSVDTLTRRETVKAAIAHKQISALEEPEFQTTAK